LKTDMSKEERRERDRQRRIAEIIDAAKQIFLLKGFTGTTMNDIAHHSDLSRRTLYYYFRSKEEVSLAAASNTLEQLLEQLEVVHRAEENGIGRLKLTLEIYRRMYESDPGGFQFIMNFSESVHSLGNDNELVGQCFGHIDHIVAEISRFIREGIADGSIRPIPEPEKTAAVLVSMVHSAIQNAVADKDVVRLATSINPEEFLQQAFSILHAYLEVKTYTK